MMMMIDIRYKMTVSFSFFLVVLLRTATFSCLLTCLSLYREACTKREDESHYILIM